MTKVSNKTTLFSKKGGFQRRRVSRTTQNVQYDQENKVENVNSQEEEHINDLSNNDNSRYVYITVTLTCAKNGKRMKTRALVDTGSTVHNCQTSV